MPCIALATTHGKVEMKRLKTYLHSKTLLKQGITLLSALIVLASAGCGDAPAASTPTAVTGRANASATAGTGTSTRSTPTNPPSVVNAARGSLDTGFGDGGRVITDLAGRSDEVRGLVVQPDGKIVALGETYIFPQDRPRFVLARYNADGTLDRSFGEKGWVVTGMTDDEYDWSSPHAIAIQPDGKLVVAGESYMSSLDRGHNVFAVARFNTDGTLDSTFGEGGRVLTPIDTTDEGDEEAAYALAVGGDGKIVLAGGVGGYPSDFAAIRYLPTGELDESFGTGGIARTDLDGDDTASSVAIQPDGKIVLAGKGVNEDRDWAMMRYTPDGEVDTAFGTDGIVSADFGGGYDWVTGIALRPDGRIMAAGTVYVGVVFCQDEGGFLMGCESYASALSQYRADGKLDEAFGMNGTFIYEDSFETGTNALALQSDGKALLAGHYDENDFAVLRVNADGTLDTAFGEQGLARTPFGQGYDVAYALAIQPDGKIVAGGAGTIDDDVLNDNFALTRYR